jgi:hypothetical protein
MDKSKIEKVMDRLRSLPESIVNVFTEYHKKIDVINRQSTVAIGSSGDEIRAAENRKAERTRAARDEAIKELHNLRDVIGERETIVRKQIELGLGLRLDSDDASENLLRETRMNQAWARLKPILDQAEPLNVSETVDRLTRQFAAAGDADSLATLRRELPLYITGRVPERDARDVSEMTMQRFDQALGETSAEGAQALTYKRELDPGVYQLRAAINYTEYAITHNELSYPLPGWKKGETFIVNQNGMEKGTSKNAFQL